MMIVIKLVQFVPVVSEISFEKYYKKLLKRCQKLTMKIRLFEISSKFCAEHHCPYLGGTLSPTNILIPTVSCTMYVPVPS